MSILRLQKKSKDDSSHPDITVRAARESFRSLHAQMLDATSRCLRQETATFTL